MTSRHGTMPKEALYRTVSGTTASSTRSDAYESRVCPRDGKDEAVVISCRSRCVPFSMTRRG